ncbi:hypothetical protein NLG97_g1097 [Lecanicillium saksenae]|uniref:Uncharacterized protein n=1 Tax=Lecanicillium saksenae TaxID=468837 RepID=A0ACC1R7D3_9HYPO|nr:hypothetical protein NLG97_g1097 [Lecanicillium saksenae]
MPDPSIYNVGWICAIRPEYVAAQAFLDEKHDRPDRVNANDSNIYTLGKLGKHNVVIGTLPDGEYGIAAGVGVAKGMLSSFPNIRIGLMVGIGGGAPSSRNDIRLGDIVVSAPRDGHGGVFQYDFGKTIQDQKFQTVGFLNQLPELLRAALTDIQAEYEMEGHRLKEAIDTALKQRPRLRQNYQRPSDSSDMLFKSALVHREIDGTDCATYCYDGPSSLVERRERTSDEDNPAIHYGTIASANQLMKDAFVRDRLAAEENVLCFEMEAAGLMNRFPCVVIRGICDYADSHKNKQWQGYAAMAAAAFAKDFLHRIPTTKLEAERQISAVLKSIGAGINSIQSTAAKVQDKIQDLHESVRDVHQMAVLDRLPIAKGASFDSNADEHSSICLPSTRVELLEEVQNWADDSSAETIFWLNGMAGTGKSTISRTVAQSFASKGRLGASFFFKRGEADRGNIAKFFPTLAADLVHRIPATAKYVKDALEADSLISTRQTREQFDQLFLKTLSRIGNRNTTPFLFIVDALDECERDNDIKLLIRLFFKAKTELPNLIKFFLTSRPELPIRLEFAMQGTHKDVILHEMPQPQIERDIFVFLNHRLEEIRINFNASVVESRQLGSDWANQSNVQSLAAMSVPLFIFAATLCLFIEDRKYGNPEKQLARVLSHHRKSQQANLGDTYLLILRQQIAGLGQAEEKCILQEFRGIVGPIVLLASPLSTMALSQLLDIPQGTIDDRLDLLHSVLSVPKSSSAPVRLLHLSFRDFLVHPDITEVNPFWVDEKETHTVLAAHCLRVLRRLKKDICGLESPGTPCSNISTERINACLPSEVQWIWVKPQIEEFWNNCLQTLNGHRDWVQTVVFSHDSTLVASGSHDKAVRIWRVDTGECVQTFEGHSDSVLSVVFSCDSKLVASGSDDKTVRIWRVDTGECIQTLSGHRGWIRSVVFSRDSTLVASGSNDRTVRIWCADTGEFPQDNTVRSWRTDIGEYVQTLEGYGDAVPSVVFSHNSALVASGSHDSTVRIWRTDTGESSGSYDTIVRIWRTNTGECVQILKGHSNWVLCVDFSHDSTLVASGSDDKTVRIWRADTGKCIWTFNGHCGSVQSVVFSHNSIFLVSSSDDKTARIWRADTGECVQTLEGHRGSVLSVVFSYDSTLIASGSNDNTVRIWRTDTSEYIKMLEGHRDSVLSLVFSCDSMLVASGSEDMTVRIWYANTGECIETLRGHRGCVRSVAFSCDSMLVASGSDDKTVRIWSLFAINSVYTSNFKRPFYGHEGSVRSVAFSRTSTLLVTGSNDNTVRIWLTGTGECVQTLRGHSDWVRSVVFSSDSTFVASGSDDKTVRIWRIDTCECVQTLRGHGDSVRSVVFLRGSTLVASSSEDKTMRIWRADIGECAHSYAFEHAQERLEYIENGSSLISDRGIIPIKAEKFLSAEPSGIGISEDWITWDGRKALWLPVEFRRCSSAVSESTVAIGTSSGNVIIITLSSDCATLF